MWTWMLCLAWLVATPAWAAYIQYDLANGHVVAASDQALATTIDRGVIRPEQVPAPAAAIVWPVPAGCPAGKAEWTQLTDASLVTAAGGGMVVRPDYVGLFFTSTSPVATGCYLVLDWTALKRLYRELLSSYVSAREFTDDLDRLNGWAQGICPESAGSANCVTSRAHMVELNEDYPGSGQLLDDTTALVTLKNDRDAFKASKGW
jgi:hypothetical protein